MFQDHKINLYFIPTSIVTLPPVIQASFFGLWMVIIFAWLFNNGLINLSNDKMY